MEPSEVKRELEKLVDEASAARDRLAALRSKISVAIELVATVRSSMRGHERTPAAGAAQEPAQG